MTVWIMDLTWIPIAPTVDATWLGPTSIALRSLHLVLSLQVAGGLSVRILTWFATCWVRSTENGSSESRRRTAAST